MWGKLKGKEAWVKENGEEAKGYVELGVMENGGLGKRNVEQEGADG